MKKLAWIVILALLCAMLSACAPGTVIMYTDLQPEEANKLMAPFLEKSGMKVKVIPFRTSQLLMDAIDPGQGRRYNRDNNGQATPDPQATHNPKAPDIVLTKDMLALTTLTDREALVNYLSPMSTDLPRGVNGSGWWYGFGGRSWVIAWNTELVKKPPTSFQDLTSSLYPMKAVTMPTPQQYSIYPLAAWSLFGREYTMNFYQTLMLNQTSFVSSPAAAAAGVATGRYQVVLTTWAEANKQKQDGKSIDFAFPDQGPNQMGAYVEFYSVGIVKGGLCQKSAMKLEDWLLSPEAEALSVKLGLSDVTLRDVGSGAPVVKPLVVSPDEIIAGQQDADAAFSAIQGGGR